MLLALFIVLMSLPFVGCSSMKKNKQKELIETEVKKESDSTGTLVAKVEETKAAETTKKETEEKKNYDVKVTNGNEVSIKEFDQNGNLKGETVIKGDGEVKTSSEKKQSEETTKTDESKVSNTKATSTVNKKGSVKSKAKKLGLEVERTGFSFGDYIFWFLLIIAIIILIYLNYRFKWVSIFKKRESNE